VTVLDLKPNSQDTSAFRLNNIQQLLADPTTSLPSEPPPFSPPKSAVWANVLLFLSLIISLTCSLLATLLHQWARRYIRSTQQPGSGPHERARVRAFFFDGIDKCHISWIVEALPTLLHLSICFFFAGVVAWLLNIDHLVFIAVVFWSGFSAVAYLWFTLSPIFSPNSPFYAPLSPAIWWLYTGIRYVALKVLCSPMFPVSRRLGRGDLKTDYHNRLLDGIGKTAKKMALQKSSEFDVHILQSTLDGLREDGARSRFFAAIPGFFSSQLVEIFQLPDEFRTKFGRALDGFLDRTFLSNSISESVRSYQLIICLSATSAVLGPDGVSQILYDILNGRWHELLPSIEMAQSLRRWANCDSQFTHYVRRIVTQIVVGVRGRDNRWISLTKDEFGVPDHVLRDNIAHGDSALLSLLIHKTREAFRSGFWTPFVLNTLTQFDMYNTIPELQHEFCSLWNEIVREAWKDGPDSTAVNILREIRHAYIGLHQGTDPFSADTNYYNPVLTRPQSYRFCNIPSHRPDWIPTPQDPIANHLIVPTPTRVTFSPSAASTTQLQLGDSPHPSPRSTSLEIHGLVPNADILVISPKANVMHTATRQAEETNNNPRFPSSADLTIMQSDHTSLLPQAFLPSTPGSVRITLPVTNQPVPEGIKAIKVCEDTQDLNPPAPIKHPQHPSKSALSVVDTDTNCVQPHDPTPDLCSRDTGNNPRPSVVVSHPSPHPDPRPTTIYPLTSPVPLAPLAPPSVPHHDASQCPSLATTLPRPPDSNPKQDIAGPWVEADISEISTTANTVPQSILRGSATLQKSGEVTVIPATIFSDPQLSPITTPAVRSGEISAELPSSEDSVRILFDHISHALGSPSEFSTEICSRSFPWPSSVLYSPLMSSNGVLRAHGDTSEMERPIPMVVLSDTSQSSTLALDIGARTPRPDDTPHG